MTDIYLRMLSLNILPGEDLLVSPDEYNKLMKTECSIYEYPLYSEIWNDTHFMGRKLVIVEDELDMWLMNTMRLLG